MGQRIDTNSDDLVKVANAISAADAEIKAAIQKMQSTLNGAQWNDHVRKRFDSDFVALLAGLRTFQANAPGTVQYLKTKANQLKVYEGN